MPDQPAGKGLRLTLSAFGLATFFIHVLMSGRYGYFRDELYYIACARHLDWGYVDMAPLSALILRVELSLFGQSLHALRFFPALAGAFTVALTGLIARELGGRSWAAVIACTASLSALVYLALGNFYSMNVFEPLFWMGCVYLLIRIIHGASPKLWLGFGLIAGLGVENKHSLGFFGIGVVLALLLARERHHFAQRWIWLGGLIAAALALPNIVWQAQHGWPTHELLNNIAHSSKNVVLTPPQFIAQQILIMNPATLPLWLGGLVWTFASKDGRRYLSLGVAYLITLGIFIVLHGKHYYFAPIYPMLFAAGAVALERASAARLSWVKPLLVVVMIAVAAVLSPTMLPILPPEKLVAYMTAIHFQPPRTETSHTAALPQLFADQFGWEEMVGSVARAYANLSPEEQKRVGIFCQNYGQAGAIDFFGPRYGLPPALCGHQNYFYWGPHNCTGEIMLVIDTPGGEEPAQFGSVADLGPAESSPWAMPWEQRNHIYLCRDLKGNLRDLWPKVKNWL